jgi:hypothetical protein
MRVMNGALVGPPSACIASKAVFSTATTVSMLSTHSRTPG